jgi:minor histocompatibility antigen H13
LGYIIGIATIILYNASGPIWWLTNIMGLGFAYGSIQLMSPTTFWTGSLVLMAMFIYDIVMVFYTPLMITVATSLDVPIKIILPGTRPGLLGLGDIVLPGIFMALALRFDLYLHYLRKQRASLGLPTIPGGRAQQVFIGAPYVDATGKWGERFWTRASKSEVTAGDAARFSKFYFKASIVGYIIAMIVTTIIMHIFRHGQPALLYLVPAELIALWGTALVRGEVSLMWGYTEDGSIDVDPKPTPPSKTPSKAPSKKLKEGSDDSTSSGDTIYTSNTDSSGGGAPLGSIDSDITSITEGEKSEAEAKKGKEKEKENPHAHHVFLLSLSSPRRPSAKKTSVFEFKGAN